MNISGQIQNQEDIELTLSITMKISEWRELDKNIPTEYPYNKISSAITDAFWKVQKTISEEIE